MLLLIIGGGVWWYFRRRDSVSEPPAIVVPEKESDAPAAEAPMSDADRIRVMLADNPWLLDMDTMAHWLMKDYVTARHYALELANSLRHEIYLREVVT